jgi:hypothetical protein
MWLVVSGVDACLALVNANAEQLIRLTHSLNGRSFSLTSLSMLSLP